MSCHYTGCSLYKRVLLSLKWDEMGGLFTVCWYCYLNLQLQLGPIRPRKIGSTFENEGLNRTTRSFSLSLTHAQLRFCGKQCFFQWIFQKHKTCSRLTLPHLEEQSLTSWPFLMLLERPIFRQRVNCVDNWHYGSLVWSFHYILIQIKKLQSSWFYHGVLYKYKNKIK